MKLSYPMEYEQQKRSKKIRQVRRSEGQDEHDVNAAGIDGSGRCSGAGGVESVGAVCAGAGAGGIVGQLLLEERDRLAQIDEELERLQRGREAQADRIQYLEECAPANPCTQETDASSSPDPASGSRSQDDLSTLANSR